MRKEERGASVGASVVPANAGTQRGAGRGRHFRRSREGGNPEGRRRHFRQSREGLGCAAADGNPVVPAKAGTQRGVGRGRQFCCSREGGNPEERGARTAIPSFPRRREPRGAWDVGGNSAVPAKAGTQRSAGRGRQSRRSREGLGWAPGARASGLRGRKHWTVEPNCRRPLRFPEPEEKEQRRWNTGHPKVGRSIAMTAATRRWPRFVAVSW